MKTMLPFCLLLVTSTASFAESASYLSAHPQCVSEQGQLTVNGAAMVGGQPVSHAQVLLKTDNGFQATATSDKDGFYTVTFEAPGAKSVVESRTDLGPESGYTHLKQHDFSYYSTRCIRPEVKVGP